MNIILDHIGAVVVAGILLLSIFGFQATTGDAAMTQNFSSIAQTNLTSVTSIIETDFAMMGYRVGDSSKVVKPDTSGITYLTDLNDDGAVDSVKYYLSSTVSPGSHNSKTRTLFRAVNVKTPVAISNEVTQFSLSYFDANGAPTNATKKIRSVKIGLNMENTYAVEGTFSGAYWERIIKPKNMR